MRSGAVAVVALVAAALGAIAVLLVGKAVGWIDDDVAPAQTVVLPAAASPAAAAGTGFASPPAGNGFNPAAIYARTSPGVVTSTPSSTAAGVRRAPASSSRGRAMC